MLDTGWPPLKLDQRNRLGLPPVARGGLDVRPDGSIELAVGVVPGLQPPCMWLMSEPQFQAFLARLDSHFGDSADERMVTSHTRASFVRVLTDNQGRLSLPVNLMEQAGIRERVTLVGKRDRLEVWATETFDASRNEYAERIGRALESFFQHESTARKEAHALGRGTPAAAGEGNRLPADIPAGR